MKHSIRSRIPGLRGFTLTELLVVIAIIIVLAALLFPVFSRVQSALQATDAVNRIRQCGIVVMQKATENNNLLLIHVSGTSSNMHDLRLYGMVREALDAGDPDKLVYTPAYEKQASGTWPVWGVNLDDNKDLGVDWERVWLIRGGEERYVEGLRLGRGSAAGQYPLLADSSNSEGVPRARFANDNTHKFAMRYRRKGPIFFLDGSARLVGQQDMGNYGITKAYLFTSDPVEAPTLVTAKSKF
jgi:prepilin-type N-terminal cleavage/methylation domain-containing protein